MIPYNQLRLNTIIVTYSKQTTTTFILKSPEKKYIPWLLPSETSNSDIQQNSKPKKVTKIHFKPSIFLKTAKFCVSRLNVFEISSQVFSRNCQ